MTVELLRCTEDKPMPPNAPGRWEHSRTEEIGDSQENGWPGGDIITVRCLNCGHTWEMELPQ